MIVQRRILFDMIWMNWIDGCFVVSKNFLLLPLMMLTVHFVSNVAHFSFCICLEWIRMDIGFYHRLQHIKGIWNVWWMVALRKWFKLWKTFIIMMGKLRMLLLQIMGWEIEVLMGMVIRIILVLLFWFGVLVFLLCYLHLLRRYLHYLHLLHF